MKKLFLLVLQLSIRLCIGVFFLKVFGMQCWVRFTSAFPLPLSDHPSLQETAPSFTVSAKCVKAVTRETDNILQIM